MPKQSASIKVTSGPGPYHQGDTVTFAIEGSGVITAVGTNADTGAVAVWANFRGDLDIELTPSPAWLEHPGPLHVVAELREQVGSRTRAVAECEFEVAG